jgi:hypothetical protein
LTSDNSHRVVAGHDAIGTPTPRYFEGDTS